MRTTTVSARAGEVFSPDLPTRMIGQTIRGPGGDWVLITKAVFRDGTDRQVIDVTYEMAGED